MTELEEEAAARVHRVTLPMVKANPGSRVNFLGRQGVWDNEGGTVGVVITAPVKIGNDEYESTASFTLDRNEQRSDDEVRVKAETAFAAFEHFMIVRIRKREAPSQDAA